MRGDDSFSAYDLSLSSIGSRLRLDRLSILFQVALLAELLRRPVAQRAVRPDLVVEAAVPGCLLPGVLDRLELLELQKLVPEAAVERLAVAVLPGPARGHLDRLRPLPRQPQPQRLADELRAVVAADA